MKLAVLGAGYVGCVSAACLAKLGHSVVAVDTVPSKVDMINDGRSPVAEPGLDELIREVAGAGRLRATLEAADAIDDADVVLVCVATPSSPEGTIDTRSIHSVFETLLRHSATRSEPLLVAIRSTIPFPVLSTVLEAVGYEPRISRLDVVLNPEFLRETTAIEDFYSPPFLVAGGAEPAAVETVLELYDGINAPRYGVSAETAALLKYASNAFHATKIAFANELAAVATIFGADPLRVMELLTADRVLNISPAYLRPGFAFGGSCLPKDLRALVAAGRATHQPLPLLDGVLTSNRSRLDRALDLIQSRPDRRLAILGLSFKKGTDDLRESPYVDLAERLIGKGYELKIYDPDVIPEQTVGANRSWAQNRLPHLARLMVPTLEQALAGVEAVVLFKDLCSAPELRRLLPAEAVIYDLEYLLPGDAELPAFTL